MERDSYQPWVPLWKLPRWETLTWDNHWLLFLLPGIQTLHLRTWGSQWTFSPVQPCASQLQYWAVHWATWASFLKLYCLKNIHSSGQCDVGNFWIQPVKSGRHKYYYQGLPGGPGKWGKDVQVSFQIQAIQLQTQDAEWTVLERDGAVSLLLPGVTFRKSCMSSSLLGEIYASPYQVLL